jgi:hypothetical protein
VVEKSGARHSHCGPGIHVGGLHGRYGNASLSRPLAVRHTASRDFRTGKPRAVSVYSYRTGHRPNTFRMPAFSSHFLFCTGCRASYNFRIRCKEDPIGNGVRSGAPGRLRLLSGGSRSAGEAVGLWRARAHVAGGPFDVNHIFSDGLLIQHVRHRSLRQVLADFFFPRVGHSNHSLG